MSPDPRRADIGQPLIRAASREDYEALKRARLAALSADSAPLSAEGVYDAGSTFTAGSPKLGSQAYSLSTLVGGRNG